MFLSTPPNDCASSCCMILKLPLSLAPEVSAVVFKFTFTGRNPLGITEDNNTILPNTPFDDYGCHFLAVLSTPTNLDRS